MECIDSARQTTHLIFLAAAGILVLSATPLESPRYRAEAQLLLATPELPPDSALGETLTHIQRRKVDRTKQLGRRFDSLTARGSEFRKRYGADAIVALDFFEVDEDKRRVELPAVKNLEGIYDFVSVLAIPQTFAVDPDSLVAAAIAAAPARCSKSCTINSTSLRFERWQRRYAFSIEAGDSSGSSTGTALLPLDEMYVRDLDLGLSLVLAPQRRLRLRMDVDSLFATRVSKQRGPFAPGSMAAERRALAAFQRDSVRRFLIGFRSLLSRPEWDEVKYQTRGDAITHLFGKVAAASHELELGGISIDESAAAVGGPVILAALLLYLAAQVWYAFSLSRKGEAVPDGGWVPLYPGLIGWGAAAALIMLPTAAVFLLQWRVHDNSLANLVHGKDRAWTIGGNVLIFVLATICAALARRIAAIPRSTPPGSLVDGLAKKLGEAESGSAPQPVS
jgi:hypothetical protein